jgi:WD40 repeat protein
MLSRLGHADVALTKRVFQRLTEPGETNRESRRPTRLRELAAVAEADEQQVRTLVEGFRQEGCSFVTSPDRELTADSVIDLTHESLIRRWPRLTEWVDEEAQSAESLRRVQDASRQYADKKKGLLDDLELQAALEARTKGRWNAAWAGRYAPVEHSRSVGEDHSSGHAFEEAMTFLDRSRHSQRRRRFKRHLVATALAAAPVFVLGLVGYHYWSRSLEVSRDAISREADPLTRAILLPEVLGGLYWDDTSLFRLVGPMTMGPIPTAVLNPPRDDRGALMSAAFSGTDGRWVSIVSANGTISRWSSDGRGRASPVQLPKTTSAPGDPASGGPSAELTTVTFSQDGEQVAVAFGDGSAFIGGSDGAASWVPLLNGQAHTGARSDTWITALAFKPDGMQVVAGSNNEKVQIWNRDGTPGPVLNRAVESRNDFPVPVTFDSTGAKVAAIFPDGTTRVWETSSPDQAPLVLTPNSNGGPKSVSFSADGYWVVSAHSDGATIHPIAPNPLEKPIELGDGKTALSGAWFKPHDSSVIVVGLDEGSAQVWRVPEFSALSPVSELPGTLRTSPYVAMTLAGHSRPVRVVFSSDGSRILTISDDGSVRVWSGEELGVLGRHAGRIESVAFSPDGNRVVSASDDRSAVIWDVNTRRSQRIAEHTDWVRRAVFSPDGGTIATASDDGRWLLHPRPSGENQEVVTAGDRILSIAFDRAGKRVVTAHAVVSSPRAGQDRIADPGEPKGTAKVWTLEDAGRTQIELPGTPGWTYSAGFSPDGARIVTGSQDGTARIWSLASRLPEVTFQGHGDRVFSASFSPDGAHIVTASADSTARIWNSKDDREHLVLQHDDVVNHAEFSSDGRQIVTASDDGTVRSWRVADGAQLIVLSFGARMRSASFDPTNEFVAAGDEYGRVYVWPVAPRAMRAFFDKWRGATTTCAPVEKRIQLLGESRSRATSTYSDCERKYDRVGR